MTGGTPVSGNPHKKKCPNSHGISGIQPHFDIFVEGCQDSRAPGAPGALSNRGPWSYLHIQEPKKINHTPRALFSNKLAMFIGSMGIPGS